ncbi:MAG: hypothetical protein IT379_28095 [Deltaproteobacteria bacterium]|nr:hypothetical protein [Deltaproteobacteria bacterium]
MRTAFGFGLVLVVVSLPALASADARVQVRLADSTGRAIDGTITMTAGSRRVSCRTTAGRCTITAPAGRYTTTVTVRAGGTPAPRTVTVPASGTISLALATPRPATESGRSSDAGTGSRPPTTGVSVVGAVVGRSGTGGDAGTRSSGGTGTSSRSGSGTSGSTASGTSSTSGSTSTAPRSLSTGTRMVCQGTIRDASGRAVDGTVTVRRGSTTVGTVRTTAGRFSVYDLPAGSYTFTVSGSSGTATSTISITSALARPVLTVR